MKKLFRMLLCAVLVFTFAGCAEETLDLSILQIQYNQVLAIHVSGGEFGEGDYLNAAKIQKFVGNMNLISKMTQVEESEVDTENAVEVEFQTRSSNKTISILPPYIKVDNRWFRVSEDCEVYLDNMMDLIRENLGN